MRVELQNFALKVKNQWLVVKKQGPRMEEFNYNTSYMLCKEFWDVEGQYSKKEGSVGFD